MASPLWPLVTAECDADAFRPFHSWSSLTGTSIVADVDPAGIVTVPVEPP
jgi:hypothetical protein